VTISSWAKKATTDLAVAALVGAFVACGGSRGDARSQLAPGASSIALPQPVDFAFDSLDDRPVSSEATRGKLAVMVFVTTSSLAAQAQVDFLVTMAKHDGKEVNYAVVALETRENRELVELYEKALSISFPVAMADDRTLAGAGPFGDVSAVPVTILLDRGGRVIWRVQGRVAKSSEIRTAMRGLSGMAGP
jgi:hypothetical protein